MICVVEDIPDKLNRSDDLYNDDDGVRLYLDRHIRNVWREAHHYIEDLHRSERFFASRCRQSTWAMQEIYPDGFLIIVANNCKGVWCYALATMY